MKSVPLKFFFLLAFLPTVFGSIFFPFFPLNTFAPFLAIVFYVTAFPRALWIAFGCGLIIDLLSSEFHLGVHAIALVTTTFLLYHQKRHFFEDKPVAISLLTILISSVSTVFQLLYIPLFDRGISFSAVSFLTDVILLPCVDGIYGFLWFTCPMRLYIYMKKKPWKKTLENES